MSIGNNIKALREERKLTQDQVAKALDISFQAVSSWERDEYKPELETFIRLTEVLGVPSTYIIEGRDTSFRTKETIYNWEHMKTYVKTTAQTLGLKNTLSAIDYAVEAHDGQHRKQSEVPYIYHPLNMACHALSMGIRDDAIIAAIMLHDVVEDCGRTVGELPVNDEAKELVRLMTRIKDPAVSREENLDHYYGELAKNPKAALIKCIDRCNNITSMSWGLPRPKIIRYIVETEKYYPELLKAVNSVPEYSSPAWLLKYQIESMLDIYKRLM